MKKIIYFFLEFCCWMQLFLLPVVLTSVIFFVVVLHAGELRVTHFLTLVPGTIAGVWLAERTRRRTGCFEFMQGLTRLKG
jgi:uncharacterized membrane protein YfcA